MIYPIAEMFDSWQGEGIYAGTPMYFIRLAGCTVGKPYPKEKYEVHEDLHNKGGERPTKVDHPGLPIYTEKCTLYDGREFPCDTDYRVQAKMTENSIADSIPPGTLRVCITGGEPMMHDLEPLANLLKSRGFGIHIETSGTTDKQAWMSRIGTWITVSPKANLRLGMVSMASEFKFLVDEKFDPARGFKLDHGKETSPLALAKYTPSFLQPVNMENVVNAKNLHLCLLWQRKHRVFRLSPQIHKMVSQFVGETIR